MSRLIALQPGDLVMQGGMSAVFIAQTRHPIHLGLQLVIWKLDDGGWSFDALDLYQDVGTITPATTTERQARITEALLGGGR